MPFDCDNLKRTIEKVNASSITSSILMTKGVIISMRGYSLLTTTGNKTPDYESTS
jgi:hypothetical protein